MLVAGNLQLSKDTRVSRRHFQYLVHQYRARGIREEYARNIFIDPTWVQDMGQTDVTVVNSADDPSIEKTSRCISRCTLPDVVALSEDRGVYRITYGSRMTQFYPTTEESYYHLESNSTEAKFDYFWRHGNTYHFTHSDGKPVRPFLILGNPLDGFVINTEFITSGNLVVGTSYTVFNTQVVHNAVAYNPGQTFTAVSNSFTGSGKVKLTDPKRAMTEDDQYPVNRTLLEYITLKIFENEFGISKQQVADIIDDAQDQTSLLQNEDSVRRSREKKEG